MNASPHLPIDIKSTVRRALSEDIGTGDLTAELLPPDLDARASVICREQAVVCGIAWFNEVYRQLDQALQIRWEVQDGDTIYPGQEICVLAGRSRTLLTGERTALNFLQCLSGTATITKDYVLLLSGTGTRLLDTRKTIPGLRTAQKYAVLCGGGTNHRMGLYDAVLIKENHIRAAGSITTAICRARELHRHIEIEVETLDELQQALLAGAERILLDNFTLDDLQQAVAQNNGKTSLEVSGGIDQDNIRAIAETGVDFISVGALTKHVRAIDFSMLIRCQ